MAKCQHEALEEGTDNENGNAPATLGGLAAFQWGFMAGVTATGSGVITIIGSLAALGITYSFLAIVKAQIDTRNAVVAYLDKIERKS